MCVCFLKNEKKEKKRKGSLGSNLVFGFGLGARYGIYLILVFEIVFEYWAQLKPFEWLVFGGLGCWFKWACFMGIGGFNSCLGTKLY